MNNIKIIETGSYLPNEKVNNEQIEKKLNLKEGYIEKRTGIRQRYFAKDETIKQMATKVTQIIVNKTNKEEIQKIGLIITATTSSKNLMPRNIK